MTEPLPDGRLDGRDAFREAVRQALAAAAESGWREMLLADAVFADWPLGEAGVVESLHAWARSGGRTTLLARNWDAVQRQHPRFVQWRITWDHTITARTCRSADAGDLPGVLWSPGWALERVDAERSVGFCGTDAARRNRVREALDTWLSRSTPGFPASVLGL